MFFMLYWMIRWKSMFLHQNFRLNLPPSELNKWTIVIIHNDAEFAEDQFGTKIFYLCHWKSWENHTHRLCENRVDFVRRWTLEKNSRPAVGKSLAVTPTCWSHTPAVGKSLGDTPIWWLHTPAVGKSLRNVSKSWFHTPAVGKSLRLA